MHCSLQFAVQTAWGPGTSPDSNRGRGGVGLRPGPRPSMPLSLHIDFLMTLSLHKDFLMTFIMLFICLSRGTFYIYIYMFRFRFRSLVSLFIGRSEKRDSPFLFLSSSAHRPSIRIFWGSPKTPALVFSGHVGLKEDAWRQS